MWQSGRTEQRRQRRSRSSSLSLVHRVAELILLVAHCASRRTLVPSSCGDLLQWCIYLHGLHERTSEEQRERERERGGAGFTSIRSRALGCHAQASTFPLQEVWDSIKHILEINTLVQTC
mmetsp:Transcript_138933/g.346363  ORF Transcript_138933/g.346363 Transcript_138933/m.346363 type:complete len:120 (+) Transcript_138933:2748-3107(+)